MLCDDFADIGYHNICGCKYILEIEYVFRKIDNDKFDLFSTWLEHLSKVFML